MDLPVTEYRLLLERPLQRSEAPQLRGFFGRRFEEAVLLHHHRSDGSLIYRYPRVQFKVLKSTAVLVGLAEGASLLETLWMQVERATLATESLAVLEARVLRRTAELGCNSAAVEYSFITPWLALSQKNHQAYRQAKYRDQRRKLLERILIGNVLSISKSFGYEVRQQLEADCRRLRPIRTSLKGTPMVGFVGRFRLNFNLPELAGCGKSVSRGFGTVVCANGERRGRK
ncbi:MAG TPA: CRISPR-associated endonuclease Cas6 [Acidobacteriota bacterium]|nr:CRISPR-associated endonuclease Cas6 [Acidobacteriota bacterium]